MRLWGIFIVFVATLVLEAYSQDAKWDVVVLTDATFDDATKDGVWMIKFFAPWCGHCRKLAPVWTEYAAVATGVYHVAEVDCTKEKEVAKRFSITGYPTLKLFVGGVYLADANVPRTIEDFVKFVDIRVPEVAAKIVVPTEKKRADEKPDEQKKASPSDVVKLDKTAFADSVKSGTWMVKFFAPWCGHCKKLAPIWEAFASARKNDGKCVVSEVDCTVEEDICSQYDVHGYPTVMLFSGGKSPIKYNGERTADGFLAFVERETKKMAESQGGHSTTTQEEL